MAVKCGWASIDERGRARGGSAGDQTGKEVKIGMTNKTYDILKYVAQIVLPALGTLYFALAQIWGFPYGEAIVGTITAVDAFLGAVLKISTDKYNDTK